MLSFPTEILESRKAFVIAVNKEGELVFSIENQEGVDSWSPWELVGAIEFAQKYIQNGEGQGGPVQFEPPAEVQTDFPYIPDVTKSDGVNIPRIDFSDANWSKFNVNY